MNFLHTDLGTVGAGSVVVVELDGTEANVLLLDDANLQKYRRGETFQYHGGHFKRSPAKIAVPSTRRWHITVDLAGGTGRVAASVRVLAA